MRESCVWQGLFQFCLILLSSHKVDPEGPCPLHQLAACFQLPCLCLLAGSHPRAKSSKLGYQEASQRLFLQKKFHPSYPEKGGERDKFSIKLLAKGHPEYSCLPFETNINNLFLLWGWRDLLQTQKFYCLYFQSKFQLPAFQGYVTAKTEEK